MCLQLTEDGKSQTKADIKGTGERAMAGSGEGAFTEMMKLLVEDRCRWDNK